MARRADDRRPMLPRSSALAALAQRPHPRRRPDADADARVSADRAAARDGPVLAVSHRGGVALRRARAGLVLEQLLLRRAHRHAFRRADPLDLRHATCRTTRSTPFRSQHFVAPACVIDCSAQAAADPDYLLTVDAVLEWETTHGRIPAGAWVLMRTDWSKRTRPRGLPELRRDRPAHARPEPRRCTSWSSSATCSASAPRRSAPTPARATTCARRTRATTSCTAPAATACSA